MLCIKPALKASGAPPTVSVAKTARSLIILFVVLAYPIQATLAQEAEPWEADRIVDSLFQARAAADTAADLSYQEIQDSVYRSVVGIYVEKEVACGEYRWPFSAHFIAEDTPRFRLTDTYAHLLKTAYGISPDGIAGGCVVQAWWTVYDSLMEAAIQRRFGADFFRRTSREADSLDGAAAGLQLPYLANPKQTIALLRQHFTTIDTSAAASHWKEDADGGYLIISFDGDVPAEVYAAKHVFYVQQDKELMYLAFALRKRAGALPWTGPRFGNAPAKATVIFGLRNNEIYFRH